MKSARWSGPNRNRCSRVAMASQRSLSTSTPWQVCGKASSNRIPPAPGTVYAPMSGRLLPGEGELPLVEMLRLLLRSDPGQVVAVEVFSEDLKRLPPREAASRVAASAADVVRRAVGA